MFEPEKRSLGTYFDFSADFNLPIGSQDIEDTEENGFYDFDNYTRRGMDSIPLTLFLGVTFGYRTKHWDFAVHTTPGMHVGRHWDSAGMISKAELTWNIARLGSTEFILVGNSKYTDRQFNNIYYGVESEDVIEGREEYDADSGYLGSTLALHFHTWKPIDSMIFGAFVEYQNMTGSDVEDSPLVENSNVMGGAGFGFMF